MTVAVIMSGIMTHITYALAERPFVKFLVACPGLRVSESDLCLLLL